jgi:hypothetical protein
MSRADYHRTIAMLRRCAEGQSGPDPVAAPFQILPTDVRFTTSPDTGEPDCLCSRCGEVIEERCAPAIRCWPPTAIFEYRFHPHCVGASPCCDGDDEDEEPW